METKLGEDLSLKLKTKNVCNNIVMSIIEKQNIRFSILSNLAIDMF